MKEEVLPPDHRILVVTETRQGVGDEMVERGLCLTWFGCKPEGVEIPEMRSKPGLHQFQHFIRHRIRFEPGRHRARQPLGRTLAILMIEVPLSALGLVPIHQ